MTGLRMLHKAVRCLLRRRPFQATRSSPQRTDTGRVRAVPSTGCRRGACGRPVSRAAPSRNRSGPVTTKPQQNTSCSKDTGGESPYRLTCSVACRDPCSDCEFAVQAPRDDLPSARTPTLPNPALQAHGELRNRSLDGNPGFGADPGGPGTATFKQAGPDTQMAARNPLANPVAPRGVVPGGRSHIGNRRQSNEQAVEVRPWKHPRNQRLRDPDPATPIQEDSGCDLAVCDVFK